MFFWRLAFRNIFRHRGRLILNLILLVGAFTTIVGFKGFKNHVLGTLQESIIDMQYAHLQVAKKSFWDNSVVEQNTDKMIGNPEELISKISKIDGIRYVSPRVSFFGLVNTEEKSVTALFIGIQPEIENKLQKSLLILDGHEFKDLKQTLISTGIKSKLKLKSNDEITIVTPTLTGGFNAMDLTVSGVFSSGFSSIDSGTAFINLKDAHKILDSDNVDLINIRLDNEKDLPRIKNEINTILGVSDLQVKTWRELAELYNQVETFYVFQNAFIEIIILLLLFLSVANTITMNVFERLSEIGTLRALGDYESDIRSLFLVEAFLLGLFSVVIAVPFSLIVISIVNSMQIQITLPMASQPLGFEITPSLDAFFEASLVCLGSTVLSSILPARKGSNVSVVSALTAKI